MLVSLRRSLAEMGPVRTAAAWLRLNQRDGFDCPGCAWPEEQGGRKFAEFCENGAKAVAEEATRRVVTRNSSPATRWPSWPPSRSTGCPSRAG